MNHFAQDVMDYFRKKTRRGTDSSPGRETKNGLKKEKKTKREGKCCFKEKERRVKDPPVSIEPPPEEEEVEFEGLQLEDRCTSAPNCLMVPSASRIRSSSFDTSQLRHGESDNTLQLPANSKRSASFDATYEMGSSDEGTSDMEKSSIGSTFLNFRYYRRRPPLDIPKLCIHCIHLEAQAMSSAENSPAVILDDAFEYDGMDYPSRSHSSGSEWDSNLEDDDDPMTARDILLTRTRGITLSVTPSDSDDAIVPIDPSLLEGAAWEEGTVTLQVPVLKPRSSSLDASYLQPGDTDRRSSLEFLAVPKQPRSTSVDVNLPTDEQDAYMALPSGTQRNRKAISKSCQDASDLLHPKHAECGYKRREIRSTVDWTDNAVSGEHTWVDTSASSDFCYVGEAECVVGKAKTNQRKKCVACRIYVHSCCMVQLERINFKCKPSFREAGPRNYREPLFMRHHWVHRRRQEGKCKQCGKSFQQRFSFQAKEIIAISCSWCKAAYHNKISCFMMQQIEEQCMMGIHAGIIIPPSWVIKMPRKGSFKSSIRKKKKASLKKKKVPTATLR